MSEPEQCIICLDPLPHPSSNILDELGETEQSLDTETPGEAEIEDGSSYLNILAALDGCNHIIHDACIRSWAQKTNTCPICREPFHTVRVYNGLDCTAISVYTVEDKKQVAEFDAQQWLGENPEAVEEESNPCPICDCSEHEDVLLLCDSCDAAYHTHCLGLESIPEGDWYCMECRHMFQLADRRPQPARRQTSRESRGLHVRTRARQRRARRQARNIEWQGVWGQFSGRFYEMSELDLDNHDDEDEHLEQYRRFQQLDRRELQRWQQRMNIAQRLGARDTFAHSIPPQITQQLYRPNGGHQASPEPPPQENVDERRAWGAFERAREPDSTATSSTRKRKVRSITASPAEPVQEPERKLKRPRTRRLAVQSEASALASSSAVAGPSGSRLANGSANGATSPGPPGSPVQDVSMTNGVNARHPATGDGATNGDTGPGSPTNVRPANGSPGSRAVQDSIDPPLVSSLLKELEPLETSAGSEDDNPVSISAWRAPVDATSPAASPSGSAHSSPRALSITPPPFSTSTSRPTSPVLSLSTHIEPRYPPANYSPNHYTSDQSDGERWPGRRANGSPELRQPQPRRRYAIAVRNKESSPTSTSITQEGKKNINGIVKVALRPHWRAQKLTTEQYANINRNISRKLYDEVKDASSLDNDELRRRWEKRASEEVASAVAGLLA